MIRFEYDLVQHPQFPGYFWSVLTKELYSIKVGGVLRKMKLNKAIWLPHVKLPEGYRISHNGRKKFISLESLHRLKVPTDEQIIRKPNCY